MEEASGEGDTDAASAPGSRAADLHVPCAAEVHARGLAGDRGRGEPDVGGFRRSDPPRVPVHRSPLVVVLPERQSLGPRVRICALGSERGAGRSLSKADPNPPGAIPWRYWEEGV